MVGPVPVIQGIEIKKVLFPSFSFERLETEGAQLVMPRLDFTIEVEQRPNGKHVADIKVESSLDQPASFRTAMVVRLEFTLPEEGRRLSDEEIGPFLVSNSMVIIWPYVREFISCATVRMGYPPLFIPMLDVGRTYAKFLEEKEQSNEGSEIQI